MKRLMWRLGLVTAFVGMMCFGRVTPAAAQDRPALGDRLERLERQVAEMGQHQEQMMRRFEMQMQRREGVPQPGPDQMRRGPQMPDGPNAPMPPRPGAQAAKKLHDTIGLLLFIGLICNILMAIWIFTDIRKRGEGSAIFVAMAIFAGIPAALIYAITRIGDKKA